jgi:hypothetical protein
MADTFFDCVMGMADCGRRITGQALRIDDTARSFFQHLLSVRGERNSTPVEKSTPERAASGPPPVGCKLERRTQK